MTRHFIIACLALFVYSQSSAHEVIIKNGNQLSINAKEVALQDLLSSFQEWGILVKIDPHINPKISVSFSDRDIQKGLDLILKSLNHIYLWQALDGPWGKQPILKEIHVFFSGKKHLMRPLQNSLANIAQDPKTKNRYIKNELLVRLARDIDAHRFLDFLSQVNGTIIDSHPGLSIYQIRFPPSVDALKYLKKFQKNQYVSEVEPNFVYRRPKMIQSSFSRQLPQNIFNPNRNPQSTRSIAILDTGLLLNEYISPYVISSYDSVQSSDNIADTSGHGTNMANIACGNVMPAGGDGSEARYIVPIRLFEDSGVVSNFTIMKSINYAIEKGAKVISMSWGSDTYSHFLDNALTHAESLGMIPLAAAGNEPTGKLYYPAAYESVIGIGATTPDGTRWKRSNYGNFVDIFAPGFANVPSKYSQWPGQYVGTSISTAFVANRLAGEVTEKTMVKDLRQNGILFDQAGDMK